MGRRGILLAGLVLCGGLACEPPPGEQPPDEEAPGVPGDPAAPFSSALPAADHVTNADDYRADAPDLPGHLLSFNTIVAVVAPGVTIGEVNGLLERHQAGIVGVRPDPDDTAGTLVALRLPTTNHAELLPVLAALVDEPVLVAPHRDRLQPAPEVLGGRPFTLPIPRVGDPPGWTWEREDQPQPAPDGNWGLEAIRAPQTWNLLARALGPTLTGVIDGGFALHPDIVLARRDPGDFETDPALVFVNDHGVHVAGTIGATFNNGVGVDGVNPSASLVTRRYDASSTWGLLLFLDAHPDLDVVNLSLGANWYQRIPAPPLAVVNPNTSAAAQAQLTAEGLALATALQVLGAGRRVPLIVAAAGNDSGAPVFGGADIDARWSSAVNAAALIHNAPGILVVEAVGPAGASFARAPFSNVGGMVAAPGVDIVSLGFTAPFLTLSGTSMATPHVSGAVGLLLSLGGGDVEPRAVLDALRATARPASTPGTAPVVDVFAAALALDVTLGEPRLLHALVDIDDGTGDGNARIDIATGDPILTDARGDGRVDMSDFRRFRDALLDVEGGATLNGEPTHPKRDLNGDGQVEDVAGENVFPRADFNGDGRLDRTATLTVGGSLQRAVTDLEVLQHLWEDEDVAAAALPDLLDSGDVHLDIGAAFVEGEVLALELRFVGPVEHTVRLEVDDEPTIQTIPAGDYVVTIRHLGVDDAVLSTSEKELSLRRAADTVLEVGPPRRGYDFTVIADGSVFSQTISNPSINDLGEVVFRAQPASGDQVELFIGRGGETTLTDYTRIAAPASAPLIGNIGRFRDDRFAFFGAASASPFTPGIFVVDASGATAPVTLVQRSGIRSLSPDLNADGLSAYIGLSGNNAGLFRVGGGRDELLVAVSLCCNVGGFNTLDGAPPLDDDGQATIFALSHGEEPECQNFLLRTDGVTREQVAQGGFVRPTCPAPQFANINNSTEYATDSAGRVAWSGITTDNRHFIAIEGEVVLVLDDHHLDLASHLAFDGAGDLYMRAVGPAGSGVFRVTAAGPEPVVVAGDEILGRTAQGAILSRFGANANGQLALRVSFADGDVIVRADPVGLP